MSVNADHGERLGPSKDVQDREDGAHDERREEIDERRLDEEAAFERHA
jgi:hypothetical protein